MSETGSQKILVDAPFKSSKNLVVNEDRLILRMSFKTGSRTLRTPLSETIYVAADWSQLLMPNCQNN